MVIIKVADEKEVISKLSTYVEKIANDAVNTKGKFTIGLSGGSLVKFITEGFPTLQTDWTKWVLAFCDERVVPVDSDDSTFGVYKRNMLPKLPLKEEQFVVIKQGVSAALAAQDYTEKLQHILNGDNFKFDVLLLGMGPDGHTCSLFPNHPLLEETSLSIAPITDSPKPPPERITMTYPVVNNAKNCIFAISGEGKAEMIKRILKEKEDLPAGRVKPNGEGLFWIVDDAAAKYL